MFILKSLRNPNPFLLYHNKQPHTILRSQSPLHKLGAVHHHLKSHKLIWLAAPFHKSKVGSKETLMQPAPITNYSDNASGTEQQQLRRILMMDGTMMTTEMIYSSSCREDWVREFLLPMYKHADMIVGFDTEWSLKHSIDTGQKETQVVLLKLCNQACCLLIKLDRSPTSLIEELSRLLVNKDILFAGMNIQKDLELLRKGYGLEIRSFVELTEIATNFLLHPTQSLTLHHPPQPQRCLYSIRGLASEVLSQPLKPRPLCVAEADWSGNILTDEQIEHATGDAYFTYKIAKKLLINYK